MKNKTNINLIKINSFILYILPISLVTGPFIPNLIVTISSLICLFLIIYNKQWNYLSVVFPYHLSNSKEYNINIQNKNSFFKYSWDNQGKNKIFNLKSDINDCYSLHLWETKNFDILSKYNDKLIKSSDNTICNIYKTLI